LSFALGIPTIIVVLEDQPFSADFLFAQRCLEGEEQAIVELQAKYGPIVMAYLRQAGANEGEANEVTDSLWTDCLSERHNNRPRLATYAGKASLKSWLYPLALNRLIARKRSEEYRNKIVQAGLDLDQLDVPSPEGSATDSEAPLIELMRDALEAGFRECAAEDFVILHLAHMDRLHLVEIAQMFDCSKSKVERDLKRAKERVAAATLRHVREVDPWLELAWEDFVDLCRVASPACLGTEEG
jgi:RNA polymerase sigma-70 factor